MCMWTLCDNRGLPTTYYKQRERLLPALCQDAGMAIEKETVDLHLWTCDWCEDVAQIHHSNSIFHLSHTFFAQIRYYSQTAMVLRGRNAYF